MKDRLESLKKQQEAAKELFIKLQGAIELVEGIIAEEEKEKNESKAKK